MPPKPSATGAKSPLAGTSSRPSTSRTAAGNATPRSPETSPRRTGAQGTGTTTPRGNAANKEAQKASGGSPVRSSTQRSPVAGARKGLPAVSKKTQAAVKQELLEKAKNRKIAADLLERLLTARFAWEQVVAIRDEYRAKAALRMQSVWRMHRAKLRVRSYDTPGHPRFATEIQKVMRGFLGRKRVRLGFVPKWEAAATYIQRLYRGSVTRVMSKQLKLIRALVATIALTGMTVDVGLGHIRKLEENERDNPNPISEQIATAFTVARNFPSIKSYMLNTMFMGLDSSGEGKVGFKDVLRVGRTINLNAALLQYFMRFFGLGYDDYIQYDQFQEGFERLVDVLAGNYIDRMAGVDFGGGTEATAELQEKKQRLDAYISAVEEDIAALKKITASKRAKAYVALDKQRRIRVARRMDRGLIQEAIMYMDHKHALEMRRELSVLEDYEDEEAALQEAVALQEERTHASVYRAVRSPCSSPAKHLRGSLPYPFPAAVPCKAAAAAATEEAEEQGKENRSAQAQTSLASEKRMEVEDGGAEASLEHSWSLFRVIRHPLGDSAEIREESRRVLVRELRCAVREGVEGLAAGEELLWKGRLGEAEAAVREAVACLEYGDGLEREARLAMLETLDLAQLYAAEELGELGERGKRVMALLEEITQVGEDARRRSWPLQEACRRGNAGTVRYLVEKCGERVNGVDNRGWTVLHHAAARGDAGMVRMLVAELGARVGQRSLAGRTPMEVAGEGGQAGAMWELFESAAERVGRRDAARELKRGEQRLSRVGVARTALQQLGVNGRTWVGNSTLQLAANQQWSEPLVILAEVFALAGGKPSARATAAAAQSASEAEAGDGKGRSEQEAEDAGAIDRRLEEEMAHRAMDGYEPLDKVAPFAPGLHDARRGAAGQKLRAELHLKYIDDESLLRQRAGMESRPVSASSAGSWSRPGTGLSGGQRSPGAGGVEREPAMLRGRFTLRLQVRAGRALRERVGVNGGDPHPTVSVQYLDSEVAAEESVAPSGDPAWALDISLEVDPEPEAETDEWRWLALLVTDSEEPRFMGVINLDVGDIAFGLTEGWFPLQDSRKWRGEELNPRSRLQIGRIRPIAPIAGEVYLEFSASNPVMDLPAPPPRTAEELYAREHVSDVLQRSRGMGKRRRAAVLHEMWEALEREDRATVAAYEQRAKLAQADHRAIIEGHLLQACSEGGEGADAVVRYCLKHGASANAKNVRQNAALLVAAHKGFEAVVQVLLEARADLSFKTSEGGAPLYHAGVRGHVAVVEMLLAANADVDVKTNHESTTLMTAAHLGLTDVVQVLIDAKAEVDARNQMGATALHLAGFGRQPSCVQALLDAGADTRISISKGNLRGMRPKEVARDAESMRLLGISEVGVLGTMNDALFRFSGTIPRPATP